jgi:hypothetical protein
MTLELWDGGEDKCLFAPRSGNSRQVRKKHGKQHRYFSVLENRRVGQKQTAQRVLDLGEINDSPEAMWRPTLQVSDESHRPYPTLSLFPGNREIPSEIEQLYPSQTKRDGIAPAARLRQLLAGV